MYFSDSLQIVDYFLLFEFELFFVGEILPFTSSANSEMRARDGQPALPHRLQPGGLRREGDF